MLLKVRNVLLGTLGLLVITFPFIWLKLSSSNGGVVALSDWEGGSAFFRGLAPIVGIIAAIVALRLATKRLPVMQQAGKSFDAGADWLGRQVWPIPAAMVLLMALGTDFSFGMGKPIGPVMNDVWLDRGIYVGLYMLLALGLNVTVGLTGLLVLGYAGFSAFGAYAYAITKMYLPWLEWWEAAPFVFLLGGLLGLLMGLPCLRLRGDYLAIVTLGFGETFRELLKNLPFTGGDMGLSVKTTLMNSIHLQRFWIIIILVVGFAWLALYRLYHSPIGRSWIAIREDETAAGAMGIPVVRMKLLAFSLSAAIAACTGVLWAQHTHYISPSMCAFSESVLILAMVILGGLGSLPGVMLGAVLLYLVPELLRGQVAPEFRFLIFGAVMVAMMIYRPQGLLGSKRHQLELQPEDAK